MFNISIKAKLYSLLIIVIAILLISSTMIYRSISPIKSDWDSYQDNVAKRQSLLIDIKSQFGYGGTIHNFKNYILRGTPKYYDRLINNFAKLKLATENHLVLTGLTDDERQALQKIKSVADSYKAQSEHVSGHVSDWINLRTTISGIC